MMRYGSHISHHYQTSDDVTDPSNLYHYFRTEDVIVKDGNPHHYDQEYLAYKEWEADDVLVNRCEECM